MSPFTRQGWVLALKSLVMKMMMGCDGASRTVTHDCCRWEFELELENSKFPMELDVPHFSMSNFRQGRCSRSQITLS